MSLREKLRNFKKTSYRSLGVRGVLQSSIVFFALFIAFVVLEYSFWFNSTTRSVLFLILLGLTTYLLVTKVIKPFLIYFGLIDSESDEEAADRLSQELPELKDDLVNYLQLERNAESELAKASVLQKTNRLSGVNFLSAIDIKPNKRYAKILGIIFILIISLAFISPPVLSTGTSRLIRFNKEFVKPAPFEFVVLNDSLKSFRNEDLVVRAKLNGENIPNNLNLVLQNGTRPFSKEFDGSFSYTFTKVNGPFTFHLESSGFRSATFQLEIVDKPALSLMEIELDYPSYISKPNEIVTNTGSLNVPAGTVAKWSLETNHSNKALFIINNDSIKAKRINETLFTAQSKIESSGSYSIILENQFATNESELEYRLNVISDEFPKIEVEFLPDTSHYNFVVATGTIADDYGFQSLELIAETQGEKIRRPVSINKKSKQQQFYVEWFEDSLGFQPGVEISLYLIVKDNDSPNGYKPTKSSVFEFNKPTLSELSDIIDNKSQSAENQIDKSLSEIEALREKLKELSDRLRSDQETDWQEEKLIEESLEQRKEIEEMLKELQEKHEDLIKANQSFEQSEELKEKSEKLNDIMKDLMDEETRNLYDELQKLLQEKADNDEIRDKLEQINRNENRRMKDLKRTKELFKRLKMETGLERIAQQLDSLAAQQLDLSNQELDSTSLQNQEEINSEFDELTEDLEEMEKLNQELERPEPLEDFESDEKQIEQELQKASDQIEQGEQKKSKKSQQDAAKQMQQMSKKMQQMQAGMEMEVMQENIEQLRKILDDLVRLSYKQETLLKDFKGVNSSDPRFIKLSQNQVKLKEDLIVIEDSLLALAGRVVQLSSFITKEIEEINHHMDGSVEQIRERQRGRAVSHQQFSMTSMNNLALLLNDVLQQMQMTMSEAMGNPSNGQPKDMPLPSLGEMQQQLGEQIKDLGKDGKSGEQLSEELARLAAEQEMIRQQLQQLQEQLDGQFGGKEASDNLNKIIEMMEDNEVDLVNKKISRQLIERQKEITTRMLEAEDALREQEKDPEREGETGQQRNRIFPPSYEEYLKERRKEIELLRSVPIELKPFYKKEVNDYFRRLSEEQ